MAIYNTGLYSLAARILGMAVRNPRIIRTHLRFLYRKTCGIALDRRLSKGLSAPPVNLSINLTRRCNLKCLMCCQYKKEGATPRKDLTYYNPDLELPLSVWIDLLGQATTFRPQLYVTGGEPLLYPFFTEFIKEAKQRHFFVHIQTNGTLLARYAEQLASSGVEIVTVSLDGPEDVHDDIRGQSGVFNRATQGIKTLVKARKRIKSPSPILSINCTISRSNMKHLAEMVRLASGLGADTLQIQHTIFDSPDNVFRHNNILCAESARARGLDLLEPSIPDGEYYQSEIFPEDMPHLLKSLEAVRSEAKKTRIKLEFLPNLPLELIRFYYSNLGHPFSQLCDYLWKTCRILPDGTVSPCLHVLAGNIADNPVLDLWNGPRMQHFREIISQELFPGCARCCHRNFSK